jgi:hypothetical protein
MDNEKPDLAKLLHTTLETLPKGSRIVIHNADSNGFPVVRCAFEDEAGVAISGAVSFVGADVDTFEATFLVLLTQGRRTHEEQAAHMFEGEVGTRRVTMRARSIVGEMAKLSQISSDDVAQITEVKNRIVGLYRQLVIDLAALEPHARDVFLALYPVLRDWLRVPSAA